MWRMKPRRFFAVRSGDWKLVAHASWRDLPSCVPNPRLIHLSEDPQELRDLREKEPAKLAELQGLYDAWNKSLPEPLWTTDKSPEANAERQARIDRKAALEKIKAEAKPVK